MWRIGWHDTWQRHRWRGFGRWRFGWIAAAVVLRLFGDLRTVCPTILCVVGHVLAKVRRVGKFKGSNGFDDILNALLRGVGQSPSRRHPGNASDADG
jgi:hypothetical protein